MKRFVIERNVPGIQKVEGAELKAAAAKSNAALAALGGKVTWEHSYVVDDKTFCVYVADSEQSVMEHAKASGFPANKVTEVRRIIDPITAN